MKTPRYGLVALTLLALTIFAPTTVAHAQAYSVLYDFGTRVGDPTNPSWPGVVAQGRDGNLYSTTANGGVNGSGAMFKITPGGTLTVQYSFDSTNGMPESGLTLSTDDGDFYGTTVNGGAADFGTVFKITPGGTLTVLHSFAGGNDGQGPVAPPIQGTDGNFYYGTTTSGGTNNFGEVYKMASSGKLMTLYSFDLTHGANPRAPLLQATDGIFYGTTYQGGANNIGTVYKITRFGNFTLLHSFDDRDGSSPLSALVQGNDGSLYGTTFAGGSHHSGVVFRITAAGEYTVLHSIDPFAGEGGSPHCRSGTGNRRKPLRDDDVGQRRRQRGYHIQDQPEKPLSVQSPFHLPAPRDQRRHARSCACPAHKRNSIRGHCLWRHRWRRVRK